jgi:hypothetical protein
MIPTEISKELHEIPESVIRAASDYIGGTNNFTKLLDAAALFRHVGARPLFMANQDATMVCVTSQETFMKKLH